MACVETVLPPSAIDLRRHFFMVLGTLSGWKTGIFVDHKIAKRAVVEHAGYDPDNLAQYGNPDDGWRMDGGHASFKCFGRRIWNVFRRGYWLQKTPLTEKGPGRGQWGLTTTGLETARSYAGLKPIGNSTAQFLDQRLKETGGINGVFWSTLRAAVASRFTISRRAGLVDDHIQTFMMRIIGRDGLRVKIAEGKTITDTHIASYILNSARNDIRDAAINPVTRELYGARTAKERAGEADVKNSCDVCGVTWDRDEGCWDDIIEPPVGNSFENEVSFQVIWERLERSVKCLYPKVWPRYMKILKLKADGDSPAEIAVGMKTSVGDVLNVLSKVQICLDKVQSWYIDPVTKKENVGDKLFYNV